MFYKAIHAVVPNLCYTFEFEFLNTVAIIQNSINSLYKTEIKRTNRIVHLAEGPMFFYYYFFDYIPYQKASTDDYHF